MTYNERSSAKASMMNTNLEMNGSISPNLSLVKLDLQRYGNQSPKDSAFNTDREANGTLSSTFSVAKTDLERKEPLVPRGSVINTDLERKEAFGPRGSVLDTDLERGGNIGPREAISEPPPESSEIFLSNQLSRPQLVRFTFLMCMVQLIPMACLATAFPISSFVSNWFHIPVPFILPLSIGAFATTFGSFTLISGRLGDIFGHKKLIMIGFGLMAIWSVLAGLSHYISPILFFVARALEGLGAALVVPNGLALLGRTHAPGSRKKIIAFSLFGLCAPLGVYLGILFGAIVAQRLDWWYNFYILGCVSILCAIASKKILVAPPPLPHQMKPFKAKLRDMDRLGAPPGVAGLILIQVAFVAGPLGGWTTSWIFMMLIMGILLIVGFVITELKIAEYPLVPFRLLKSDVLFVIGAAACGWAVFGILLWYIWSGLVTIRIYTPLTSATHMLPIVPVALIAAVLVARFLGTTRPAWILLYASIAATLGPLFLFSAPATQSYWGFTFVSLLLMPFFMTFCLPVATYVMSNHFPIEKQGVAGSLIATTLNFSMALGLGLGRTVEVHSNPQHTNPYAGIQGGWLMGIGIGGLGILICASFLFKSLLSAKAPAPAPRRASTPMVKPMATPMVTPMNKALPTPVPTIRKLDVNATEVALTPPEAAKKRVSRPATIRTAYSDRGSRKFKHPSAIAASFRRARRGSNASQASSQLSLTRASSPDRELEDDWDVTALPDSSGDRAMPLFERRQLELPAPKQIGATYHRNITQQMRFSQAWKARAADGARMPYGRH